MGSVLCDFRQQWLDEIGRLRFHHGDVDSCSNLLFFLPNLFPASILPSISDAFLCQGNIMVGVCNITILCLERICHSIKEAEDDLWDCEWNSEFWILRKAAVRGSISFCISGTSRWNPLHCIQDRDVFCQQGRKSWYSGTPTSGAKFWNSLLSATFFDCSYRGSQPFAVCIWCRKKFKRLFVLIASNVEKDFFSLSTCT